jgi:diguanylate cyclase (GGDEF)-like protein
VRVAESIREELDVEESRTRAGARLEGRDRWATALAGVSFFAAAAAMAAFGGHAFTHSPWLPLALILTYAVATRVEFEIGPGSAVPTELILIPLIFLGPLMAPIYVASGMVLGALPELAQQKLHRERVFGLLASSWHAVGPALVIWTLAPGEPRLDAWPVYLLALAAQFVFDFASTATRHVLGRGVAPSELLRPFGWVFLIDAMLAPVGLLAAFAAAAEPARVILVTPMIALLGVLARDRRRQIDRSIELGRAYANASEEARTDLLTGVRSRLAWEEALVGAAAGGPGAFAVALIDIDGLKAANDAHGHDFGDRLLRAAARAVTSAVRTSDLVARIGGDEFAVLAPGSDVECLELVERIREAVAAHPRVGGFRLGASVGGASAASGRALTDALLAADAELYAQKALARAPRAVAAV